MSNYRRNYIPGGTYFFTVVTHHRKRILCDDKAREALRQGIKSVQKSRPFSVDAIVLMPDHLHTIWTLPAGEHDYSMRWNQIKGSFTKLWLAQEGAEASRNASRILKRERGIWQRRLFEHTCRDEDDLKRCLDYLHVNPLKHRLVSKVADWPWSSFHRHVQLGEYSSDWGSASEWYGDEWRDFE